MKKRDNYQTNLPDIDYFKDCSFLCIDIEQTEEFETLKLITETEMPLMWKEMGFDIEDVNAAREYAYNICRPNAVKIAGACRKLDIPMIFVHWGCLYEDQMDLDPEVRKLLFSYEDDKSIKKFDLGRPWENRQRPADFLGVREKDYVMPKTSQDAFRATSLEFLLTNLGIKKLILIGGHTGACLGKTSRTAKSLGFKTMCIVDATFNAFESNRIEEIMKCNYNHIVKTTDFLRLVDAAVPIKKVNC